MRKRGFSKAETAKVIASLLDEEGRPPESIFDFVQGITVIARAKPHQDARLELEGKAKALLERAADDGAVAGSYPPLFDAAVLWLIFVALLGRGKGLRRSTRRDGGLERGSGRPSRSILPWQRRLRKSS